MGQIISLNDAVYRMMNPQAQYYDRYSVTDFNKINCPFLHEYANGDPRQTITYANWVKLLGGNPATQALQVRSCGRIRAGTHDGYGYIAENAGFWGYTFGKPKGPNGKPLAESKILDDTWFYYDKPGVGTGRWSLNYGADDSSNAYYYNAKGNYGLTTNPLGDCIVRQYYASGWKNYYHNPKYISNWDIFNGANWFTLDAGVYLMSAHPYYDGNANYERCGFDVMLEDNTIKMFCRGGLTSGAWATSNMIFFVDTEVKIRPNWWSGSGSSNMMFMLFKITPPGYWE